VKDSLTLLPDAELASRLAKNTEDRALLTEAYRRFYPLMVIAARRVLRDHSTSEEVAQDAFAGVLMRRSLARLRNPADVAAYLATSARFLAVARKRTSDRQEMLASEFPHSPGVEEHDSFLEPEMATLEKRFRDTLEYLPSKYADALRLRVLEGRTIEEIAEHLGVSYVAAAQRLSRGMAKLRQLLE